MHGSSKLRQLPRANERVFVASWRVVEAKLGVERVRVDGFDLEDERVVGTGREERRVERGLVEPRVDQLRLVLPRQRGAARLPHPAVLAKPSAANGSKQELFSLKIDS